MKQSQFISFVKKEFIHIFRDVKTMLVLFAIPITLVLLFGFAISNDLKRVKVAVVIPDGDQEVAELVRKIDAGDCFEVVAYVGNVKEIDRLMKKGRADAALVFENSTSAKLLGADGTGIDVIIDASNSTNAATEAMYLTEIIYNWLQENAEGIPSQKESGKIVSNMRMLYNSGMESSYNFVPGVLGMILMLICSLMTSTSVVREKENGNMEVLLVSPMRPFNILIAKMIPYFVLSCVDLAIILVMAKLVLGLPMTGSLFWTILSSIVYIILSLSIGLLVSTFAPNQTVASVICGMVFLFPVLMMSGMMFPIESLPVSYQWFSAIIPGRWYISIIKKLMVQGCAAVYIFKELIVLCGMVVVCFSAIVVLFKDKLN